MGRNSLLNAYSSLAGDRIAFIRQAQSLRQAPKAEIERLMVLTWRERNNDQRTLVVAAPEWIFCQALSNQYASPSSVTSGCPLNNSNYPKLSVIRFFRRFKAPISHFRQDHSLVVYVTWQAGCDAIVEMWHICEN